MAEPPLIPQEFESENEILKSLSGGNCFYYRLQLTGAQSKSVAQAEQYLDPNSIIKRVKAAKVQAGETQQEVKSPEKGGKQPSKRTRVTNAAPQIREDGRNAEQFVIEPEASREFCISQMEMDRAVKAKDSNHELRRIGCVKKTPGLDRILIDQASKSEKKTWKQYKANSRPRRRLCGRHCSELSDS